MTNPMLIIVEFRRTFYVIVLLPLALLLVACSGGKIPPTEMNQAPRDLTSQEDLSPELRSLRILWPGEQVEGQTVTHINLDGSDPLRISLPEYALTASISPTARYAVYATSLLLEGNIEMQDLQTQERRILVLGQERFPGGSLLNPSFSPDEEQVIFEVRWKDRIDLAIVDVASGKVQYHELGGGFNMWPEVSPDGEWILVTCESTTLSWFSLCILDQTQRVRRYLVEGLVSGDGDFTPDGQFVVYITMDGGIAGERHLYKVSLDGQGKELLVSGLHPGVSVLGLTKSDVIFTCKNAEQPTCRWVCVVGLDGSDVRRLTYLGERCIDVNAH